MPGSGETMPKGSRQIQRNCLGFGEAANRETAQRGDMAMRAERLSEVASERADIGPLADNGLEISVIAVGECGETKLPDLDRALGEARRLAGARQGIGAAAGDFNRGVGGRTLLNRSYEPRQHRRNRRLIRANRALRNDLALAIVG